MAQNIESYQVDMVYTSSNGWKHPVQATCYKCKWCGAKWEPDYYGQDSRWWCGAWDHKCPKAPKPPVVPAAQVEQQDSWDV